MMALKFQNSVEIYDEEGKLESIVFIWMYKEQYRLDEAI